MVSSHTAQKPTAVLRDEPSSTERTCRWRDMIGMAAHDELDALRFRSNYHFAFQPQFNHSQSSPANLTLTTRISNLDGDPTHRPRNTHKLFHTHFLFCFFLHSEDVCLWDDASNLITTSWSKSKLRQNGDDLLSSLNSDERLAMRDGDPAYDNVVSGCPLHCRFRNRV